MATYHPSRKISNLDEPEKQGRAHKWCSPMDPLTWLISVLAARQDDDDSLNSWYKITLDMPLKLINHQLWQLHTQVLEPKSDQHFLVSQKFDNICIRVSGINSRTMRAIKLMRHLTYNLDQAPSEYYLFKSNAHFLCSWNSNNKLGVERALCLKRQKLHEIKELEGRCLQRIQHDAIYFEH